VVGCQPDHSELYEAVRESVEAEPTLMDVAVAEALARSALELMTSGLDAQAELDAYYEEFRQWKQELPDAAQSSLLHEVASAFLNTKENFWLRILALLAKDVASSDFLHKDVKLVQELFDYAFGAAKEEPKEGSVPLLSLLQYLRRKHLTQYVDQGLDTLIAYEADRKSLDRMEPFLRMIENSGAQLTTKDVEKAVKFCKRMLGPSNSREERKRTLSFVHNVTRDEVTNDLRGDLEEVANSEDEELATVARAIIG
jgi:hypothetical protein